MVVGEFFFVFLKESEVNALLKYRKVGRNHMFFYCSSIVSKKEYYEIFFSLKIICCMSLFYWILFLVVHLISFVICRLLGCV